MSLPAEERNREMGIVLVAIGEVDKNVMDIRIEKARDSAQDVERTFNPLFLSL